MPIRRWVLVSIVFLAACDAGIGRVQRRALDDGRAAARSWIANARASGAPATTIIAVGYLERLRLGLGSPFRLAEHALHDPRLGRSDREALAWAILARTLDRDAYRIDPVVLEGISPAGPAAGADHLALIERAIRDADDPRAGELAVRRAYAVSAEEGTIAADAADRTAPVAALIRDRELARRDVHTLLIAAQAAGADPLVLLATWRAERRFVVEAPPLQSRTPELERDALEIAHRLVLELPRPTVNGEGADRSHSLLDAGAAARLAALADSANAPAQAPVAVAVADARQSLLEEQDLREDARRLRELFIDAALSEERFVAAYALLDGARSAATARTALAAAVALRAYAQEPVWFPGFAAPSAGALEERYGLSGVAFGDDVPVEWQPYYARQLDLALSDLMRVMPALDVSGLRVVVTGRHSWRGMLAVHEPRRRRIVMPPASAAGALAHEIAHDLDWQLALGRYDIRGDYASDAAARGAQDPLAHRLRDLAAAYPDPSASGDHAETHANRPTEIFARSVEWYVAVALAADGRSNGYLTSIQDEMLKGYGSARPPDASGLAGEALIAVLDDVAPLPLAARAAYLARYGRTSALQPAELLAGTSTRVQTAK